MPFGEPIKGSQATSLALGATQTTDSPTRQGQLRKAINQKGFVRVSHTLVSVLWLITAGLLVFWAARLPLQQRAAAQLVVHTLQVLGASASLQGDVATINSEARSFIIVPSKDTRARFDAAVAQAISRLADLQTLTADNMTQQQTITELRPLIDARVAVLRSFIDQIEAGDRTKLTEAIRSQSAIPLITQIAATIERVIAEERRLLEVRQTASRAALWRTIAAIITCGLILAVSGFVQASLLMTRAVARRHAAALAELNSSLEQRVAERTGELAASMARQRGYFEHSPIGMFVMRVGPEGQYFHDDMNPAASAIFGLERKDVVGRTLREVWAEAIADGTTKVFDLCVAECRVTQYNVERQVPVGRRALDVQIAPLLDERGVVRSILSCVRDVTEQRELERRISVQAEREAQITIQAEQQAEAAERETALFRSSPDILFAVSINNDQAEPGFVFEAFGPALERLTGLHPDALTGRTPEDCLPPAMAESLLAHFRACLATTATVTHTARYEVPLGTRDFEGSITPVQQPATGKVIRLVGALRDVTERNLMEATLRQSQRIEAIGRLAAGVAHDFNNVLQGIVGGLEMVMHEVVPGTAPHKFASLALNSAVRGAYLTHHLLSYARRQVLQPKPIAPSQMLLNMREVLARTLPANIVIEAVVDADTPSIQADESQLETALLNLAINAADAMPQGGTLAIEARELAEDGQQWVALTVSDSGSGMDHVTLAQAIEPFFTTKGPKGTGLGLSMVQGFVAQSGGKLHIDSWLGHGTRIEMRLPAAAASEVVDDVSPAPVVSPQTGRLLVVDDAMDVLMTTSAYLEKAGFQVERASNSAQALAIMANSDRFDAIISDFSLPDLNGTDLIMQCRLLQPDLPAVIVTGFAEFDTERQLADGILTLHKPYRRQELLGTLQQMLQHT